MTRTGNSLPIRWTSLALSITVVGNEHGASLYWLVFSFGIGCRLTLRRGCATEDNMDMGVPAKPASGFRQTCYRGDPRCSNSVSSIGLPEASPEGQTPIFPYVAR